MHGEADAQSLNNVVYLEVIPGEHFAAVRKPRGGIAGLLERMEKRLVKNMLPSTQAEYHVRGSRVAQDYIIHALLQHSEKMRFTFLANDPVQAQFAEWAEQYSAAHQVAPITILPALQSFGNFGQVSPDVWLDLRGEAHSAMKIRNHLSETAYPIMTLQHGISGHHLKYDSYLRTLLLSHQPFDSLVSTSQASRKALRHMLDMISESLAKRTGTVLSFECRTDVIPLCVDTEQIKPLEKCAARSRLQIDAKSTVILFIGYLSQVKADLIPLLPALKKIVSRNPQSKIKVLIAGTGPDSYKTELSKSIRDLELIESVKLLGSVSDNLKLDLLCASDVFIGPCDSLQESFGLTPIEAMAAGLPQVVADWSGYRETVVHGVTGFRVPTRWGHCDSDQECKVDLCGWAYDHIVQGQAISLDMSAFIEALETLVLQPELRQQMSRASRERATALYSYRSVARLYDDLSDDLVRSSRTLKPTLARHSYDRATYFETFKHFATEEVTAATTVSLSDHAPFQVERIAHLANKELPGPPVFDVQVMREILHRLNHKPQSIRELSSGASNVSSERILRHVLLLIKFGRLNVTSLSGGLPDLLYHRDSSV